MTDADLDAIRKIVREEVRKAQPTGALLTFKAAALDLGIDRGEVARLVAEGLLHAVRISGQKHPRIPRTEIERAQREGLTRPVRGRAAKASTSREIDKIKV